MAVQEKVVAALKSFSVFNEIVEEGSASDAGAALAKAEAAVADAQQMVRFGTMVECAYLIASADGTTTADEVAHIKDNMSALTDGAITGDVVGAYIEHAAKMVEQRGRDQSIASLAERLKGDEREIAFIAGASAAWTGGGVGVKEGLCMQALAKAFGWEISHMHKLLGKARG